MRPSLWILRPFGQPSYCAASSQLPRGSMRKMRPNGMSTHQRLPCRSNDGPSRKQSTAAPWRLGSDHAVRRFSRNFAGSTVKRRTSIFFISWKGFSIGMRRRIRLLTFAYKEEPMRSLVLLALSLVTAVAFAQPNVRVRGTITGLNGDVLSVKSRDGKDLQVHLTPEAQIAVAKKTA